MSSLRPLALGALIATTAFATPVPNRSPEGTLRGFPVIVDPESGKTLAHGTHTQWIEGGLLHVKTAFRFEDGRATTEEFTLERGKDLVQRSWSFLETRGEDTVRKFKIDFKAGTATGEKHDGKKTKTWKEKIDVVPGETFAGGAFAFALGNLAPRLVKGESIELHAVGITPKPRVVTVKVFQDGGDEIVLAGQKQKVDRFVIRPQIPKIAKWFVKAPDNVLYFYHQTPATFVRAVGPLLEPGDPIYETDAAPPPANRARNAPGR